MIIDHETRKTIEESTCPHCGSGKRAVLYDEQEIVYLCGSDAYWIPGEYEINPLTQSDKCKSKEVYNGRK